MTYKAILKSIEAKESWDNNGDKWTKYIFTFDNGHAPFVFRTDLNQNMIQIKTKIQQE